MQRRLGGAADCTEHPRKCCIAVLTRPTGEEVSGEERSALSGAMMTINPDRWKIIDFESQFCRGKCSPPFPLLEKAATRRVKNSVLSYSRIVLAGALPRPSGVVTKGSRPWRLPRAGLSPPNGALQPQTGSLGS